jgi:hypothetical protein
MTPAPTAGTARRRGRSLDREAVGHGDIAGVGAGPEEPGHLRRLAPDRLDLRIMVTVTVMVMIIQRHSVAALRTLYGK